MKKLNLEKLKLAAEDVLQRSQMAGIYGGSGGSCPSAFGTCGYNSPDGYATCGWSRETVECFANRYGGNWCCDSCGSATYC
ncbi:hypothetical protein [Cyclobacterium plantarum]|uniref:hypothetical protein n=1 Tax=Cyclobacterium plantarum TaxID=2716263 RepID=UPI003F70FD06